MTRLELLKQALKNSEKVVMSGVSETVTVFTSKEVYDHIAELEKEVKHWQEMYRWET